MHHLNMTYDKVYLIIKSGHHYKKYQVGLITGVRFVKPAGSDSGHLPAELSYVVQYADGFVCYVAIRSGDLYSILSESTVKDIVKRKDDFLDLLNKPNS